MVLMASGGDLQKVDAFDLIECVLFDITYNMEIRSITSSVGSY